MENDNRYVARLRAHGLAENDSFSTDIFENAEESLGVWDTIEKRFVKRNQAGEWVPETI